MEHLRIMVVDDHDDFGDRLEALLANNETTELVGSADNGADAVRTALELQTDVVLIDIHMPRLNGIEATQQIVRVLTAHRGPRPHDDGGRGVSVRGHPGRGPRLPAEGCAAYGDPPLDRGSGSR